MAKKMELSRITLRPFELSDVDDFMVWAGDDRVMKFIRWNVFTSKEQAHDFIRDVCIPHPWRRSICVGGRSVGFVSVYPLSGEDRCKADVGYAVAREYWGRGIATEALRMAVPEVFERFPDVVRLQAFVSTENRASQRVVEKVGFQKEGILRKYCYIKGEIMDLIVYSFLSSDCKYDEEDRVVF